MIQDIFIQSSHEGKEGLCNPPHPPLPLHISGAHHSITQALRGLIGPQAPHCSNQEDGMPDGMHCLPTLGRQLSKQLRINIELTRRSIYSREIIEETKKINPLICLTSLDFQYCCVSCVARSTILEKPS